jgi:hypothetical protein
VSNQKTLGKIITTDGSSNGNQGDPRIIQFGLKFVF